MLRLHAHCTNLIKCEANTFITIHIQSHQDSLTRSTANHSHRPATENKNDTSMEDIKIEQPLEVIFHYTDHVLNDS